MKHLTHTLSVLTTAFAMTSVASAQSSEELAIDAFNNSELVQEEIATQMEHSGLEIGSVKTLIQDTSTLIGFVGVEGHDLVLVAQHLISPPNSFHPTFTSVLALVLVSFDGTALQPTVSEPQLVSLGDPFLTALYSPLVTDKQDDETILEAALRALSLAAEDTVDDLVAKGYKVMSSDLIQLTLGRQADGGLTALFAGSIYLAQSTLNGDEIVLNGYFYKDPVGAGVRGTILTPFVLK